MLARLAIALALVFTPALILVYLYMRREKFAAAPSQRPIAYSSNPLNYRWWLADDYDVKYLDPTLIITRNLPDNKPALAVVDPLEIKNALEPVATSPPGYFVVLSTKYNSKDDCSYNFPGKTVGYADTTDLNFIRAILSAGRVSENSINLVRVPVSLYTSISELLRDEKLDRFVTYVIPDSPWYELLAKQKLIVDGFTGIEPEYVRLFYPYAEFKEGQTIVGRWKVNDVFEMSTNLYEINPFPSAATEGFAVKGREAVLYPPSSLDPDYRCYGAPQVENKAECDSPYDAQGNPKIQATKWSKPCKKDADCPFYSARTGRGNCNTNTGICELPLGVRRVGYREYTGTAFEYGPDDPAFAGDEAERRLRGEKTQIVG